jgi:hypothetical protein
VDKDNNLDKIYSVFKFHGLPQPKIKGKGLGIKLIPVGEVNLLIFSEKFPDIKLNYYSSITCEGIARNTEYEVYYKLKDESINDDEAFEELHKVKKAISGVIVSVTDEIASSHKKEFEKFEDRIPEKLRKNIKAAGNFSNVKSWEVKVVLGNCCGEDSPRVGEMCDVGYTMINIDTGELVPIARSDEHNMGYDLMRHYRAKKLISEGRYYPIYFAQNYVYDELPQEVSAALKAFRIWLDLGGENTPVSSGGNRRVDYMIRMEDFIKANGQIDLPKGSLLPVGKRIVQRLEKCAELIKAYHLGKPIKEDSVCDYAEMIIRELSGSYTFHKECSELTAATQEYRAGGSLKSLEEALFSHNGFKNEIHMDIKSAMNDKQGFRGRDSRKVFGDLEFAFREFNRLSMI